MHKFSLLVAFCLLALSPTATFADDTFPQYCHAGSESLIISGGVTVDEAIDQTLVNYGPDAVAVNVEVLDCPAVIQFFENAANLPAQRDPDTGHFLMPFPLGVDCFVTVTFDVFVPCDSPFFVFMDMGFYP